ncbi:uncharacterized protein LAESUDRAFT_761937 [Laetiporus sulphureus 93-53]|uniref:Uncharacterized protein n=1 Tax=Laetiporus sulphureus 93-53 TaxID=1314785 RepID=A0A165CSE0_9APHY|nr:uncharacterized protein LAESUDRAFT_761937 [Laetiporus sulphureus 93-53]KZT03354.1 hypothetical protein LAESUDRAFT_761937 [Laetiporus sulphureus 93-53]
MPDSELAHLSISTLKVVLFQNHVNVRLIIEKEELMNKMCTLLGEERHEHEKHVHDLEVKRLAEEMRGDMEEEKRRKAEQAACVWEDMSAWMEGIGTQTASGESSTNQPDHFAQNTEWSHEDRTDEVMSPPPLPAKPPASSLPMLAFLPTCKPWLLS